MKGGKNSIPERLVITAIALKRGREGISEGRGTWKRKNIRKKDRHLEIVRPVVPRYFFRFRGRMSTGGFFFDFPSPCYKFHAKFNAVSFCLD